MSTLRPDSSLETNLQRIKEVDEEEYKDRVQLIKEAELEEEENKLKKYINEQIEPLVQVAKENMVVNATKNSEFKANRNEFNEIRLQMLRFQSDLGGIRECDRKIQQLEEGSNRKYLRLRSDMAPLSPALEGLKALVHNCELSVRNALGEMNLREKRILDLEERYLAFKDEMS